MPDGIELVLADHRRVETLFAEFAETEDATVAGQIVDALTAHDQAEHSALYPLVGELLGDDAIVEQAALAHSAVKQAIEHLVGLEGAALVVAMQVLRETVDAHVQDEEEQILPALRDAASPGQLDGLAARIEQTKQRVG
jgi:hemerythrin superfamily protein